MSLNPKLMALPGDALLKLREEVNAAFEVRQGEFLQPGRFCWFYNERTGRKQRCVIDRFGLKYIIVKPVNEFGGLTGEPGWRMPGSMLNPERAVVKPTVIKGAGADAPQHSAAGSF